MRVFGSTRRQTVRALLRGVMFCLVLALTVTRPHHAVASGLESPHTHSAATSASTAGLHPEAACQGASHCAPVFVVVPSALILAATFGARMVFADYDALPFRGRTVDPGQHPPKAAWTV
jgi:hypothetical protein